MGFIIYCYNVQIYEPAFVININEIFNTNTLCVAGSCQTGSEGLKNQAEAKRE